jgi:hypothetical protein
MTKHDTRPHHHHKHYQTHRAVQAHGAGRPLSGRTGLQLPEYHYSGLPGSPRVIYPPGWMLKQSSPGGAALLFGGVIMVVVGIILAIARIFGG